MKGNDATPHATTWRHLWRDLRSKSEVTWPCAAYWLNIRRTFFFWCKNICRTCGHDSVLLWSLGWSQALTKVLPPKRLHPTENPTQVCHVCASVSFLIEESARLRWVVKHRICFTVQLSPRSRRSRLEGIKDSKRPIRDLIRFPFTWSRFSRIFPLSKQKSFSLNRSLSRSPGPLF